MKKSYALKVRPCIVAVSAKHEKARNGAAHSYILRMMLLTFILFGSSAYQDAFGQESGQDGWTLLEEINGVRAYYRIEECSSNRYLQLKIENAGEADRQVAWYGFLQGGNETVYAFPTSNPPKTLLSQEQISSSCQQLNTALSVIIPESFIISDLSLTITVLQ